MSQQDCISMITLRSHSFLRLGRSTVRKGLPFPQAALLFSVVEAQPRRVDLEMVSR